MPNPVVRFGMVDCNLCGADTFDVLWGEGPYRIVECLECSLRYLNPRPPQDELEELYSPNYFREYYVKHQVRRLAYFRDRLIGVDRVADRGWLLDIGCGPGFFLHVAKEAGWAVKGIDTSTFAVEYARREFDLDVVRGHLGDYAADSPFDVVTIWDVIAHVPEPLSYVKIAHKLLRRGGVIVIKFPYRHRWMFSLAGMLSHVVSSRGLLHIPAQLYHFTPSSMERMLRKTGFRPLEAEKVDEAELPFCWTDSRKVLAAKMAFKAVAFLGVYESVILYGQRE